MSTGFDKHEVNQWMLGSVAMEKLLEAIIGCIFCVGTSDFLGLLKETAEC